MSSVPPPGSAQSVPPPLDQSSPAQLSWEGDKMFNIYIYDYCYKRGFRKTARELLAEAEIPPESQPPINARQGLLFEWWSVFWVLFTAKANGHGTEDAMIYTQHQSQQAANRQAMPRPPQPPQPPPAMNPQPPMQQQPMVRGINGMQPGRQFMPNGTMPNGVNAPPMPQGHMQTGPGPFPMPGAPMNGLPGPPGQQQPPGVPTAQPPNYQQMLPGHQRPGGPQQRPANGMPPFQSPTLSHSHSPHTGPQGQPLQQPPQGQQPPPHAQPPIGQMGPSPHMPPNRGMLPPNGPQMNPGQQQGPIASSSYQPLARPPSRTNTPGQGSMMTNPSPSLMARQPMGPMGPGTDQRHVQEQSFLSEIMRIPPNMVGQLKQELGMDGKEPTAMTFDEKRRLVEAHRQRSRNPKPNPTPGPSNPMMQPPNQRNVAPQPPPGARPTKRNSTSPGEETEQQRTESSPPDRKRPRRSPVGQPPLPYPPHGQHPQPQPSPLGVGPGGPPQQQGQPPQMMNNMMRQPMGGPQMNGGFQPGMPQMGTNPMTMSMSQMSGGPMGSMSPAMSALPGQTMMNTHMQPMPNMPNRDGQNPYRTQMQHQMHNRGMPGNTGSPASDPNFSQGQQGPAPPGPGPQFNPAPGPNNRMQQKSMSMMPPPSPGMNNKDQGGQKDGGKPDGSPHAPPGPSRTPNSAATAPPTPAPNPAQTAQTAPSPSQLLGNPPSSNGASAPPSSGPDMSAALFTPDFIQSVANSLDEFDPSFLRPDGDINFERDFGQWFNHPDDVGGALDLK
ncbi:hypothetical protein IW262DRAFT_1404295 [Armillaria fumosa]|nr:hypothetical protein IW262DRAFT_1404295 [Armillaria fumosa]